MPRTVVRIGTRGSRLALAQAGEIQKKLRSRFPKTIFKIVIVKTLGDEFQAVELFKKNKTGVFTGAIEKKLLDGSIDMAVHSLKDLPTGLPAGLTLAAFPKRQDARDALISKERHTLESLPLGARVGTGSPRRGRQIHRLRPDLKLVDIRGNLDTRVAKVLKKKDLAATVVAMAGLLRLKKYLRYARPLPARRFLPAPGQAALAIEIRKKDNDLFKMARRLNDKKTELQVTAERRFLRELGGGCRVPAGVSSVVRGSKVYLRAAVFSVKSGKMIKAEGTSVSKMVATLFKKGARKILNEARAA
ncbi:MAG: hydroxymethylbilane synthase [Candidatus Omnitrophica bacterium]|nr:hydroxymethylbilane synthase [Candidatus Omnitrophota bacterium]